jgi:hypothetical protein
LRHRPCSPRPAAGAIAIPREAEERTDEMDQAGSNVEDYDPLGGRADRLGDRAVIRVVEIGVTPLRRGRR